MITGGISFGNGIIVFYHYFGNFSLVLIEAMSIFINLRSSHIVGVQCMFAMQVV